MLRYLGTVGGDKRLVEVDERDGQVTMTIDGVKRTLAVTALGGGHWSWIDGTRVVSAEVEKAGGKLAVTLRGQTVTVELADARIAALPVLPPPVARVLGPATLRAPMAGRVVKLLAGVGETVKAGQGVLVMEAMKMENELRAPREGRVREIRVAEGAAVEGGEELAILE
jgi:biotin carboxyl carrier protein